MNWLLKMKGLNKGWTPTLRASEAEAGLQEHNRLRAEIAALRAEVARLREALAAAEAVLAAKREGT